MQNPVAEYEWLLGRLRKRGIFYSLNFMFGLDGDHQELFDETMAFLERVKAPMAFFNVATPRRGTPMWDQLNQEGRVHNPEAEKYLGMICNFYPKLLSEILFMGLHLPPPVTAAHQLYLSGAAQQPFFPLVGGPQD